MLLKIHKPKQTMSFHTLALLRLSHHICLMLRSD
jgi:hypothetical protein